MGLFNKSKSNGEYDDNESDSSYDDESRIKRRKSRAKDFRDLNPENRKKRKEPKKPWGKKERFFVLAIILLTAGTSGILAFSARAWKLPGVPRIKIPSFSLPFFSEETIILEGDRDSVRDREKADEVTFKFKEATKNLSGVYGLYIVNLTNGYSFGVNENETFTAASLIKLPVMVGMYIDAEAGNINLDDKYTLKSSDKVAGAGSLYGKPAGYQITYRNLIQLMGKQSDNTAFNICRKYLGDAKIQEITNSIGMSGTDLVKNETTPKDIGVFFEELWMGNIISKENRDEFLNTLTDTIYEDWLVAGIPDDVRIAHKYGREVHAVNDAGIVFTDRPYVIVIMSKGVVEREADEIFPELAKGIYEILTQEID